MPAFISLTWRDCDALIGVLEDQETPLSKDEQDALDKLRLIRMAQSQKRRGSAGVTNKPAAPAEYSNKVSQHETNTGEKS